MSRSPDSAPPSPVADERTLGRAILLIGAVFAVAAPGMARLAGNEALWLDLLAAGHAALSILWAWRGPSGGRYAHAQLGWAYAGNLLVVVAMAGHPLQFEATVSFVVFLAPAIGFGTSGLLWVIPFQMAAFNIAAIFVDPSAALASTSTSAHVAQVLIRFVICAMLIAATQRLLAGFEGQSARLQRRRQEAEAAVEAAEEARKRAEVAEKEMRTALARAEEASEDGRRIDRKANAAARAAAEERGAIIDALRKGLSRLSDGDMTVRLADEAGPDAIPLHREFDAAVEGLASTLSLTMREAAQARALFDRLGEIGEGLAARSETQAEALDRVGHALDRLVTTLEAHEAEALRVAEVEAGARGTADGAARVLSRTRRAMAEIETTSQGIARITGIIDHIAFQTGLLALNAGVEASRAGEAGRGFGVVATEVRQLARRAAKSARDIADLVETGEERVADGVRLAEESGRTVTLVAGAVSEMGSALERIYLATHGQKDDIAEVRAAAEAVNEMAEGNGASGREAAEAIGEARGQLGRLLDGLARFHLPEAAIDGAGLPSADPSARPRGSGAGPARDEERRPGSGRTEPDGDPPPPAKAA